MNNHKVIFPLKLIYSNDYIAYPQMLLLILHVETVHDYSITDLTYMYTARFTCPTAWSNMMGSHCEKNLENSLFSSLSQFRAPQKSQAKEVITHTHYCMHKKHNNAEYIDSPSVDSAADKA